MRRPRNAAALVEMTCSARGDFSAMLEMTYSTRESCAKPYPSLFLSFRPSQANVPNARKNLTEKSHGERARHFPPPCHTEQRAEIVG